MLKAFRAWRRERILGRSTLDNSLWRALTRRYSFMRVLGETERARLHDLVVLFLHQKSIVGAGGLEVREEMRVGIAAQACMLILNLDLDWYRGWTEVIVYPDEFLAEYRVRRRGRGRPSRARAHERGIVADRSRDPLVGGYRAGRLGRRLQRGDPRVRAQARHAERRRQRVSAAARGHEPRELVGRVRGRLRRFLRARGAGAGKAGSTPMRPKTRRSFSPFSPRRSSRSRRRSAASTRRSIASSRRSTGRIRRAAWKGRLERWELGVDYALGCYIAEPEPFPVEPMPQPEVVRSK